jgi:chromosomal replication initiation ATPase DnaA
MAPRPYLPLGSERELREIARRYAERLGVPVEVFNARTGRGPISEARQEAMTEAYETGRFSCARVGRAFGGRDHSTVCYARRKVIERRLEAEEGAEG